MTPRRPTVLGLCGSPRRSSSHQRLLLAAAQLGAESWRLEVQSPGPRLPHFDPETEQRHDCAQTQLPASVRNLRDRVAQADALIVCCPEYAGGIVGSFKNALDWLVGGTEIYRKPFSVWSASPPSRAVRASLLRVLRTMGGVPVPAAHLVLPLRGVSLSAEEVATRYSDEIGGALDALTTHLDVAK